jgi:hypothetical protein
MQSFRVIYDTQRELAHIKLMSEIKHGRRMPWDKKTEKLATCDELPSAIREWVACSVYARESPLDNVYVVKKAIMRFDVWFMEYSVCIVFNREVCDMQVFVMETNYDTRDMVRCIKDYINQPRSTAKNAFTMYDETGRG